MRCSSAQVNSGATHDDMGRLLRAGEPTNVFTSVERTFNPGSRGRNQTFNHHGRHFSHVLEHPRSVSCYEKCVFSSRLPDCE